MPMWRCPHCGTPQPEAARCWVCRRSSTTCSTCRRFRVAVAGGLGYCGLDRRRIPLTGLELRGCWEAPAAGESGAVPDAARRLVAVGPGRRQHPGFVPVDLPPGHDASTVPAPTGADGEPAPVLAGPASARPSARPETPVLTLFGDPEP